MRTFPKELSTFRTMIEERGSRLRQLSFVELKQLAKQPLEDLEVGSLKLTIGTIVRPLPNGGLSVVLQGFIEHDSIPGKSMALDAFDKHPDETVSEWKEYDFFGLRLMDSVKLKENRAVGKRDV